MMNGKKICKSLREIRCRIARANDIDYTPAVCTHEGNCSGTCPACESELRYIERQLLRRTAQGKKIVLAGLALGAASLMPMQAQQVANTIPPSTRQQPSTPIVDAAPGDTTAVVVRLYAFLRCAREACQSKIFFLSSAGSMPRLLSRTNDMKSMISGRCPYSASSCMRASGLG